jgi:NAD-dependent dihydropyrimidine dehydrogenase PreA subunit
VAQRPDDCTGCELCARLCPDLAITVMELEHTA